MTSVGILGATGFAGAELARLLMGHPGVAALHFGSSGHAGESLEAQYPNLSRGLATGRVSGFTLLDPEALVERTDILFSALPHGHGERLAQAMLAKGGKLIDLSADFRFGSEEAVYKKAYGLSYEFPGLHAAAVYGLPELFRKEISAASVIGNPGCYPTATSLGLFPGLRLGFLEPTGIIVDAASGVTGAGKEPQASTHYASAADSLSPYKIGAHRHEPEMARILSIMAGKPASLVFTPHLAPMGRGIVATIYARLAAGMDASRLHAAYRDFYAEEPFVRVLPAGCVATNRNVRLSNYCDISVHASSDPGLAIIVSAIDNMVKGAAGQAVQNMNLALGLPETQGLEALPPAF